MSTLAAPWAYLLLAGLLTGSPDEERAASRPPVLEEEAPMPASPAACAGCGELQVETSAPGCRVHVDDQAIGAVANAYGVQAGKHQVRVECDGFEPWRATVVIRPSTLHTLRATPVMLPSGSLVVRSNVSGDQVFVDDAHLGQSGRRARQVPAGTHAIRVEKPGYLPWSATVSVPAGGTRTVRAELRRPASAFLIVRSNVSGDRLFIDDHPVGKTGPTRHQVTAARHEIRVERPGFEAWRETVELEPGQQRTVQVRLQRVGARSR